MKKPETFLLRLSSYLLDHLIRSGSLTTGKDAMALTPNVAGAVIVTAKANEHGSAVGKTPPTILYLEQGLLADELAAAKLVRAALIGLQVPNTFSGMSYRPSFEAMGDLPSFVEHSKRNDWPEANGNRLAKVLVADATGKITTTIQVPYLADNKTEADVSLAFTTLFGAYNFQQNAQGVGAGALTQVLRVSITSQ